MAGWSLTKLGIKSIWILSLVFLYNSMVLLAKMLEDTRSSKKGKVGAVESRSVNPNWTRKMCIMYVFIYIYIYTYVIICLVSHCFKWYYVDIVPVQRCPQYLFLEFPGPTAWPLEVVIRTLRHRVAVNRLIVLLMLRLSSKFCRFFLTLKSSMLWKLQ